MENLYLEKLENVVCKNLDDITKRTVTSLSKNKFEFVSQCLDNSSKFAKFKDRALMQMREIDKISVHIKGFSNLPISEQMQHKFYGVSKTLFENAVKFGYCGQAERLLEILTNRELVGERSKLDQSGRINAILNAYGKRYICEEQKTKLEYDIPKFIDDVTLHHVYGEVKMNEKEMLEQLNEATVSINGVERKPNYVPHKKDIKIK